MKQTSIPAMALLSLLCLDASAATNQVEILIPDVPHVLQKSDFCGEACVEMVLRKLGVKATQDNVFNQAGVDPAQGRGCYTPDLARAMKAIGFSTGDVWYPADKTEKEKAIETAWKALLADLVKGIPSIVCTHYDSTPSTTEHFRLVLGYDPRSDDVIYHEPAAKDGAYLRMKKSQFTELWPLASGSDRLTLIRFRCAASAPRIPAAKPASFSPADYAQHVMALRKKIGNKPFHLLVEPPFVVIGDEPLSILRRRSESTVKWAVTMLKKEYFARDPGEIIDIWLFKDKASYEKNTLALFHEAPTTPFGFFSDSNHALIMNIDTGGGTLVHEIVHPYIRANFPKCPAWLNEGLGSLYEQCEEKDGHIHGRTNWRLKGLQETIQQKELPTFKELTHTSDDDFYTRDRGSNYAQARYLCYYLQEKGLLARYYREFVARADEDPTGYATLQQVLGEKDMDAFKTRWEKFVTALTFP